MILVMRMVPDLIVESTKSRAEKHVFRALRQLEDPGWFYALHSLNVTEHQWKRVCEIDFLVVGPRGIYAVEVKGGNLSCSNGVWHFVDRSGQRRRRENPFTQVRTAMFSLQKLLAGRAPAVNLRRVSFGSAVVLPDCDLEVSSVEWSPEEVIDRRLLDSADGVRRGLGRMASYWQSKPGSRAGLLSEEDAEAVLTALRPDFDTVPTLWQVASVAEAELASLTVGQYRALDAHVRNPRVVYEGGAGTGKTLLAVELARRQAALGRSVLFTCRSEVLTGFVKAQPGIDGVDVVAFARLRPGEDRRYDVMVVDEAQDVLNFEDLSTVDESVAGGLADGSWFLFLDGNNQRGLIGAYEPAAMVHLLDTRPAQVLLTDNCRNTRPIVRRTQEATGADVGVSTAGAGPEVTVELVGSPEAAAVKAAKHLDLLGEEGVPPVEIMLLSSVPLARSVFARLPGRWRNRLEVLDLHRLRRPSRGRLGFARTGDFKGLESRFVLLDHLGVQGPGADLPHLYVGMTRARVGLWIVADRFPGRGRLTAPGGSRLGR
jgi:hypothetical protein